MPQAEGYVIAGTPPTHIHSQIFRSSTLRRRLIGLVLLIEAVPPAGRADIEQKKTVLAQASEDAMVVDTMGGRMHVRWDESSQATPHGQIAFFAEFLATAGVFDHWVDACPLRYSSPNASSPRVGHCL